MLAVSDAAAQGAPPHADMEGRRGGSRASRAGWSIASIARHLGRDRKTIRAYLDGDRVPGQRQRSSPDPFAPFADYVAARLAEDRHVGDRLVRRGPSARLCGQLPQLHPRAAQQGAAAPV